MVPRIRDQTLFGTAGRDAELNIHYRSQDAMIVLYHSIEVWNKRGILKCIQRLGREEILYLEDDWTMDEDLKEASWRSVGSLFYRNLASKSFRYFCTTRCHFEKVREDLFQEGW